MLATLRPLFPYLRRYRRDFVWGGLAVVISNAIWIFFPQVIRIAIDDLNQGVTRQKDFPLRRAAGCDLRRQGRLSLSDPLDHHRYLARD